ncbi:hypothetical protein SO802_017934 [Lithocarpus litseifolius]|uniref:Telomere-associated protein Rif1 N-terminal domain-containing protein n=1 Tax=Lithocarpus litseifolius TaxID=425828 RepID=A0AAW2CJV7_9ROSI
MASDGKVVVEKVGEKSSVTRCFSNYPLKLIIPRKVGPSKTDAVWIYSLTYGGGIVSGDSISCEFTIGDACTTVLKTQALTKVYKSMGSNCSEQVLESVCNLGVWCISIQQFNAPFLDSHYNSLLQAVVHALDNPIGSLSTTFEAIRVLVKDMKQILLTKMKELLNQGMKVQAIHAWGWFICLLGSYAMKNRQLTNEMLKIPENTFSDLNPQVQIASQFAWEGLIDALIHPPIVSCEKNASRKEKGVQHLQRSRETSDKIQANGFLKSLRLVMNPLTGSYQVNVIYPSTHHA